MKASSLREHTDEELRQLCEDTSRRLFEVRAGKGAGDSSEQPLLIRSLRRDMAIIKTLMKERGLSGYG